MALRHLAVKWLQSHFVPHVVEQHKAARRRKVNTVGVLAPGVTRPLQCQLTLGVVDVLSWSHDRRQLLVEGIDLEHDGAVVAGLPLISRV